MATTLADHLRSLPDEALGAVLLLRPDLVVPVPTDVSALAVRSQSRVSVSRALDDLDQFTLQILDGLRLTRNAENVASAQEVLALVPPGADRDAARAALDRLRARFLVYGPENALHVVSSIDEVSSPYPVGLGRLAAELDPRTAELCADPAKLRRTLLSAPPPARAVLDRLAAGPPVGTVANEPAGSESPVGWLIQNALVSPIDRPNEVAIELPREIGLLLRRDTGPLGTLFREPPALDGTTRDPKAVDSAGAGQAMETVRHTGALLEALGAEPAPVLRSGGLGVRDLRRLARGTGLDEPNTALLLEVAYAAGLIGEVDTPGTATRTVGEQQTYLPTAGYEVWRNSPLALRWEQLTRAWLAMTRQVGLVGQRDDRDRPFTTLSVDIERAGAPGARLAALGVLAELGRGVAPGADEVLSLLAWRAPRRAVGREAFHREALAEAALLGVTGLGALTSYGRFLVAAGQEPDPDQDDPLGVRAETVGRLGDFSDTVRTLDALLPAPVDHVLVQADLSVVVPGPPEPALAAELEIVSEQESAGGASVHRVTGASIRGALDAGYAADDLHDLFRRRSRTPVPQALTYLIDDVARRHGGLRVGGAGAYLRSDDEVLLTEVLADRRLTPLSLRRLAPTVLITPFQVGRMLTALREAGFTPVPEDTTGATVLSRQKTRRAAARGSVAARANGITALPKLTPPRLRGIVEQIRRGDAAARAARRAPVTVRAANGQSVEGLTSVQAHTQAVAVLQQAVRDRALVWVGYVDTHGATLTRLVRPVSLGGGYLRAEDERTEMLHTFALHRVTAAVLDG